MKIKRMNRDRERETKRTDSAELNLAYLLVKYNCLFYKFSMSNYFSVPVKNS